MKDWGRLTSTGRSSVSDASNNRELALEVQRRKVTIHNLQGNLMAMDLRDSELDMEKARNAVNREATHANIERLTEEIVQLQDSLTRDPAQPDVGS